MARTSSAGRRAGYAIGAAVNAAIWYAINVWPGWQEVPFLTGATTELLWLLNLSLAVGVVANLLYMLIDRAWLKALGDVITTAIGLAVLVRTWQVFPFDFGDASADWVTLTRGALIFLIVVTGIALVVQVFRFPLVLARGRAHRQGD